MKEKYIDFVSSELFKYPNISKNLEQLGIYTIYVIKEVKTKEDVDYPLPSGKQFRKALLFTDLNLLNTCKSIISKNTVILGQGKDILAISNILSTKIPIHLFDPIVQETSIDEGLARIAKQNNKLFFFNINQIRNNQNKSIKQMQFSIPILEKHKIEFKFISYAKTADELLDPVIIQEFLKNFNLEKPLIKRTLTENI